MSKIDARLNEAMARVSPLQRAARERADLIRTLHTLVERYHGDAGCSDAQRLTYPSDYANTCPACDAAAMLARIEGA